MAAQVKPQRFLASTSVEALEMVKADLGEDAVLVDQKTLVEILVARPPDRGSGVAKYFGATAMAAYTEAQSDLGGEPVIMGQQEMVALWAVPADDAENPTPALSASNGGALSRQGVGALLRKTYGAVAAAAVQAPAASPAGMASGLGPIHEMLNGIQEQLDEIERLAKRSDRPAVSAPLMDLYQALLDNEVTEDLARLLVEKVQGQGPAAGADGDGLREALAQTAARLIPVEGEIHLREDGEPTVVVLVGPTGVGKTTTLAKLATQFKVHHGRQVSLVTEDTSRPGGMEQLRAVAQLLSIPLTVADTVERVRAVMHRDSPGQDVILIDTAGRVAKDPVALRELAGFLDAIQPDEVHLCLSCLCGHRHALDVIQRFDAVRFDRLLLTKLDEATACGMILNVAAHVDRGLSYVTTGQGYMGNIRPVDALHVARLVMGNGLA